MEVWSWLLFLATVLIGSYIQTVAGFAMAMLMAAIIGGFRVMDVPTLAAVISLVTIANVIFAIRGRVKEVQRRLFVWLALGQIPAIFLGLQFMTWLDDSSRWTLEIILGVFITVGGLSMYLRPHPWQRVSNQGFTAGVGFMGGIMGGMFGASGPILGWFAYNQPLPVAAIRATLLASFILTTSVRTIMVGVEGGLTTNVWLYSAAALPVVLIGTWAGRTFEPPVSEEGLKKFAYLLLLSMGIWILVTALM